MPYDSISRNGGKGIMADATPDYMELLNKICEKIDVIAEGISTLLKATLELIRRGH